MPASPIRLVVDTNVILRGLLNIGSASGKILDAVEKRLVLLLLSKPVLAEYRAVLGNELIVERFPELTVERVEVALRRLRYLGEYLRTVRARFDFPRDPRDEMLLELAISGKATHLVSTDNDLLSLPGGYGDAAKRIRQRLPKLRIASPADFLDANVEDLA